MGFFSYWGVFVELWNSKTSSNHFSCTTRNRYFVRRFSTCWSRPTQILKSVWPNGRFFIRPAISMLQNQKQIFRNKNLYIAATKDISCHECLLMSAEFCRFLSGMFITLRFKSLKGLAKWAIFSIRATHFYVAYHIMW